MTLCTNIIATTEVDPHATFHECRQLLGATEKHPWNDREFSGERYVGNEMGIGLPALMWIEYQVGRPLRTAEDAAAHEDWCDDDCDGASHNPACWLEVNFDTAYGYRDEQGRGCGALHADLVAQLGRWFDARGIEWAWQNEFTGEWHSGEARYERLCELHGGGEEAEAWFRDKVLPAIGASLAGPLMTVFSEQKGRAS